MPCEYTDKELTMCGLSKFITKCMKMHMHIAELLQDDLFC